MKGGREYSIWVTEKGSKYGVVGIWVTEKGS